MSAVPSTSLVAQRARRGWSGARLSAPARRYVRSGLYGRGGPLAKRHKPFTTPDRCRDTQIVDFDPHPFVAAAIDSLRPYERAELGSTFDSIARDLIGEFCLAKVEGIDPVTIIAAARHRYAQDRHVLIHGLDSMTDLAR